MTCKQTCGARGFHISTVARRDVMAKYRRPLLVQTSHPTLPQAPLEPEVATGPIRRDKEVIVEGVPIPPKPIPPGDEGE